MGIISNIIAKLKAKKEKYNEFEEQQDIVETWQQRRLSSDERELNKYVEEKRQERIKQVLNKFRKERADEFWHKDIISQKSLFNNQKNIFKNHKKLFTK